MLGRTGKQFLLYYILFFICLVVLFVLLYQINLSMVSRSYLNATENLLRTGIVNLEMDLGNIEAIAQTIYKSPKFRRLSYMHEPELEDYYYAMPMVDDFKSFFVSAGMIADCGIVYGNNVILTTKRLYFPWEQFYGRYFMQAGIPTADRWIGEIPRYFTSAFNPQGDFITTEGSYKAITFCRNFSGSPENRAFFFATLEINHILSRLTPDAVLKMGRILIYDSRGTLLIDSGKSTGKNDSITLEMIGGKRGIRVRIDIPRRVFREQLAPFHRLSIFFTLAYLAAGIVLSILFAQRSARPIREIVEDVLSFGDRLHLAPAESFEKAGTESLADFRSDYTYIRHFLTKVERDLETFNERLAQQEELQRENLFERILYGLVYSAAWQTVKDYFPHFPETFRIAAVALPDMKDAALSAHTIRQVLIQDIIEPYLPPGAYVHFSGNLLVLLLPGEESENLLRGLSDDLRRKLNARCRTALSEIEREPQNIHQAFYLVRHLLRLPAQEGDAEILQKGNRDAFSFPLELLDASRLYELLLHGDEDKAIELINNMFYELCCQGYAREDDIQQIFFIYRRVFLQITGDLSLELPEGIIPAYDSRMELSFLFARVADAARNICGVINSRSTEKESGFERSVVNYIDENITNPGMYTKMVTGFFHISENRLQAIMRNWTGKSFLEYVEAKRMALSREMLLRTTKPISRITRECGYSSENTFYKAFRRFYGQSPSEIRR
jgi:AraC-like DNA-binding protein